MVLITSLDDKFIPYYPIQHRDITHILKEFNYPHTFHPENTTNWNQSRVNPLENDYVCLWTIPGRNLLKKCISLSICLKRGVKWLALKQFSYSYAFTYVQDPVLDYFWMTPASIGYRYTRLKQILY